MEVEEAAIAVWVEVSGAKVAEAILQDLERVGLLAGSGRVHTSEEPEPEKVLRKPAELWWARADQLEVFWEWEVAYESIN